MAGAAYVTGAEYATVSQGAATGAAHGAGAHAFRCKPRPLKRASRWHFFFTGAQVGSQTGAGGGGGGQGAGSTTTQVATA